MDNETLEQLGELVDKADNILALRAMPLPNAMLTDGLLRGLEEMRDALLGDGE